MIDVLTPPTSYQWISVAAGDATQASLDEDSLKGVAAGASANGALCRQLLIEVPSDAQLHRTMIREGSIPVRRLGDQCAFECAGPSISGMPDVAAPRQDSAKDDQGAACAKVDTSRGGPLWLTN